MNSRVLHFSIPPAHPCPAHVKEDNVSSRKRQVCAHDSAIFCLVCERERARA